MRYLVGPKKKHHKGVKEYHLSTPINLEETFQRSLDKGPVQKIYFLSFYLATKINIFY